MIKPPDRPAPKPRTRRAAAAASPYVQASVVADDAAAAAPLPRAEPARPRARHSAELAHATHGRVRLKIPGAKNNPALLAQVRTAFEGHPGIDAVEIKPATGSIVVYYDVAAHPDIASLFLSLGTTASPAALPQPAATRRPPNTEFDEKIHALEEEAEFLAEHSDFARSIVEAVKSLDRQIKRSTNNQIDLKILAPVGLAGFTFLEIGAAAATPMWVTLVIFSLNHFVELRAHDAEERARR